MRIRHRVGEALRKGLIRPIAHLPRLGHGIELPQPRQTALHFVLNGSEALHSPDGPHVRDGGTGGLRVRLRGRRHLRCLAFPRVVAVRDGRGQFRDAMGLVGARLNGAVKP